MISRESTLEAQPVIISRNSAIIEPKSSFTVDPFNETCAITVECPEIEIEFNPEFTETNSMLTNNLTNNKNPSFSITTPELKKTTDQVSKFPDGIIVETN